MDLLQRLPYPVALTAQRWQHALQGAGDLVRTLTMLKDCFEVSFKYLSAVLLDRYLRSGPVPASKDALLTHLVQPSLGQWVNDIAVRLAHELIGQAEEPSASVAALFARRKQRGGTEDTSLRGDCRAFVQYRNKTLGHGALRPDDVYRSDLADWGPMLDELLRGIAALADWRLCLVTAPDRCQSWMGPAPSAAGEPGDFRPEQQGRFVLVGPAGVRDLYPFLCHAPDPAGVNRLHFYESLHHYKPSRKEAQVLAYERGEVHPRPEPIAGLEAGFTGELLAQAVKRHVAHVIRLERSLPSFGVLLEEHAEIVGRGRIIERVRRFVAENESGLLLIEGAPGAGKTALVAHLVGEVFALSRPLVASFFYRRTAGLTDPDVCLNTLYQDLLRHHNLTEPAESGAAQPQDGPVPISVKLSALLKEQIAPRLPHGRKQLIFIEALDEADRDAFGSIPEDLPRGVIVIASTRPVAERRKLARRGPLEWLNLDAPEFKADNERDSLAFVQQQLSETKLPPEMLRELARRGAGNFLVLKLLCRHVRSHMTPAEVSDLLRRLATRQDAADQLGFFYAEFRDRLRARSTPEEMDLIADVAGVLVLAHSPLSAAVLSDVLGVRSTRCETALRALEEFLVRDIVERDGVTLETYRIYHESFATFLRAWVEGDRRRLQGCLAEFCRKWSEAPEGLSRAYALRGAVRHLLEVGSTADAAALLQDWRFLEAKTEAGMTFELAGDFAAVVEALPRGEARTRLSLVEEALRRDIHFLHRHPAALFQCLWNNGWWFDGPAAARHYEEREMPGQDAGVALHNWLERWRREKEGEQPGFAWLRSLRPPVAHLGSPLKMILRGHADWVYDVSFSPAGERIASASADRTIRLWDVMTGAEVLVLRGHEGGVRALHFSPDGRRLASASDDRTVRIWDAADGTPLLTLTGHHKEVRAVCFSRDGRVAAGSDDATVSVWDPGSGQRLLGLEGHDGDVRGVSFSPDGQRIASASADRTVRIWDTASGTELLVVQGHDGAVNRVSFSPDGTRLASASEDETVRLWDAADGRSLFVMIGHQRSVRDVRFSRDGRRLVSASEDLTLRLWDAATGIEQKILRGHESLATSVCFHPDGRLASGSVDKSVRVWDPAGGVRVRHLCGHDRTVSGVVFSPDGRRVASASEDRTVRLWDALSGEEVRVLDGHTGYVHSVAFSACGRLLVSTSSDRTVRVWDVESGDLLRTLPLGRDEALDARFSTDGQHVVATLQSGTRRAWDVESGTGLGTTPMEETVGQGAVPAWRAVVRDREITIEDAEGRTVGWFPLVPGRIEASPSGRVWVAAARAQVHFLVLEGAAVHP